MRVPFKALLTEGAGRRADEMTAPEEAQGEAASLNECAFRSTITTNVLVVGSGAIRSVFARLLVAAGRQVTMIDAGPIPSRTP